MSDQETEADTNEEQSDTPAPEQEIEEQATEEPVDKPAEEQPAEDLEQEAQPEPEPDEPAEEPVKIKPSEGQGDLTVEFTTEEKTEEEPAQEETAEADVQGEGERVSTAPAEEPGPEPESKGAEEVSQAPESEAAPPAAGGVTIKAEVEVPKDVTLQEGAPLPDKEDNGVLALASELPAVELTLIPPVVADVDGLPVEGLIPIEEPKANEASEMQSSSKHQFGSVLNIVLQPGEKKKSITKSSVTKYSVTKVSSTKTNQTWKSSSTKTNDASKLSMKELSGIASMTIDGKRYGRRDKKAKQKEKAIHAGLNLRTNYKIIIDGNDVTPKTLHDNTYQGFEEKQLIALDLVTGLQSQLVGYSTGLIAGEGADEGATRISNIFHDPALTPISFDMQKVELDEMTTLHYEISTKPEEPEETVERAPSAFCIPIVPEPTSYPKSFSLVLKETETIFLLDMQSLTVEKGTSEAARVEADNDMYEYLTEGKGRKRKMTTQYTQTQTIITKNRQTLAERSSCRNNETFASEWEMLDTFRAIEEASKNVIPHDPLDSQSPHMIHHRRLKEDQVENELEREAIQAQQIISKPSFKSALLVIERLLASNVYEECQKKFRGLITSDPCRMDIQFTYRLDLLWTFNNTNTSGRSVSSVKWNYANHDILAVGYGRFYYGDNQTGLVAVWNIKNPTQPEREYNFKTPVTVISFSRMNPNLLAVGFYDGDLIVLDISSTGQCIVSQSNRFTSNTFEPIWQMRWYREDYSDAEFIMCTGQDGRISRYQRTKTTEMVHSQLMRVCRLEGEVQGVHMPRRCVSQEVSISRYPAALVLRKHPTRSDIYFIGTDEGCVYRCSINYPNQHLAVVLAHTGPVFAIEFSPFLCRIYLTCGGDWHFRLWAEDIDTPILSMRTGMDPVQSLSWSPIHSCIIACAAGNSVQMWDLSRKMVSPSGVTELEAIVTLVNFTESGHNIVVATVDGAVHTFTVEDMPYPPYFQGRLLLSCIKKALIGNPELVRDLDKLNLHKEN